LLAMVVNDDACCLNQRGALESIASKLAPTRGVWCVRRSSRAYIAPVFQGAGGCEQFGRGEVIGLSAEFIDLHLCLMNKRMALARTVAD